MMANSSFLSTLSLGLALLLSLSTETSLAAPPDARQQARRRFDEAVMLVEKGDVAAALLAFKEAYALAPNPAVLYNIAQAYRTLGRTQEAVEALERYRQEAGPQLEPARRQAVDQQLRALREQMAPEPATGELEVRCLAAGTRVMADGRWLGEGPFQGRLTLAEGTHEVRFEHRDQRVELRSVKIAPGKQLSETCTLPIPPPAAPVAALPAVVAGAPPRRASPGPFITLASGGALVGGAVALHLWNDGRHDRWKSEQAQLEGAPPPSSVMEAADLDARRNANNGRLRDVQRTDAVVWGLAAAGGLALSLGAAWLWRTYSH